MSRHQLLTVTLGMSLLLSFTPSLAANRDDGPDGRKERPDAQKAAPARPSQPVRKAAPPTRTAPARTAPVRKAAPTRSQPTPRVIVPERKPPPPGYVLDKRHRHNQYYPRPGYEVPSLPDKRYIIRHRDSTYYYDSGIWYRTYKDRYIVVLPPIGLYVPVLPPFYTILWFGSIPYYYAGGVYYTWYPEYQSYVVAEAPPADAVSEGPYGSDELFIYPKRGQSEEQQAKDRYECHRWATSQTGYDPTLPDGGVTETELADKRADYLRAMRACLEARDYSVQ